MARKKKEMTLAETLEHEWGIIKRSARDYTRARAGEKVTFWRSVDGQTKRSWLRPLLRLEVAGFLRRHPKLTIGRPRYSQPCWRGGHRQFWEGSVTFVCRRASA